MKYIKKVLLVLCIVCFLPSFSLKVAAAEKGETEFSSLEEIPLVLDGLSEIKVVPSHSAYQTEGYRNKMLGAVVSKENGCLITFSIPELAGLDNLDIEDYNFGLETAQKKQILMVTAEYYEVPQGAKIADFWLFVFNPADEPLLTLELSPNQVFAKMDASIATICASSKETSTIRIWDDSYTKDSTRTSVYQSFAAGMSDYAGEGWFYEEVDDVEFSYGVIDLPYDMRKYLDVYLFDYNEYCAKSSSSEENDPLLSSFWEEEKQSFDLDGYVLSLGGTAESLSTSKDAKVYLLNGHKITIGYYKEQAETSSWVEWSPSGVASGENDFVYTAKKYQTSAKDSLEPVQIDTEGHLISRWDFDFVIDLLNYCKRTAN